MTPTDQAYRLAIDTITVLMDSMNELEARMRIVDPVYAIEWTARQRVIMGKLIAKVVEVKREIEEEVT